MSLPAPQYSARQAALKVLRRYSARRGDASELLGGLLKTTDRGGQATDLVYGVIRNSPLLDRLVTLCADIEKSHVKPALRDILRLGVYELVFAPKTAEYAIVNEAVKLARAIGSQKSGGFVNAVLRSVQRQIAVRDGEAAPASLTHAVPRADGSVCVFVSAVLPDPSASPAEYLYTAWSLPQWLVRQWVREYGPETAGAICRASNRQPSVYAWPDRRRISAETLAERLTAEGVQCRVWAERGAVQLSGAGSLSDLESFNEGLFYIQDPAAEGMAAFLDPASGDKLIDMCAAPGGKTLALALRMKDSGCILASDVSVKRLGRLENNIRRLNLSCVRCVPQEQLNTAAAALGDIDTVIVDVPCSNTGVLARRVEARRRLDRGLEKAVLELQQSLLGTAYRLLRRGGKLLYSTCSVLPEENEEQIRCFLRQYPDFTLIKQQKTLPIAENADLFDHDGGYLALLVRG